MIKVIKLKLTFQEEILGTASSSKDLHLEFVAGKAPDAPSTEEEVESLGVEKVDQKGRTVFSRDSDGTPILWNYQMRGWAKDACGLLWRVPGTKSKELKAYKKTIDGTFFAAPRRIRIQSPSDVGRCDRPLRAQTAQGERVCIASSETLPVGSWFEVEFMLLDGGLRDTLIEWLDYGMIHGIGGWRSSGKGIFTYEILSETEHKISEMTALLKRFTWKATESLARPCSGTEQQAPA